MKTLTQYWVSRWAECRAAVTLLVLFLIATTVSLLCHDWTSIVFCYGAATGVLLMFVVNVLCFGHRQRNMAASILLMLAVISMQSGVCQDLPPSWAEPLPAYAYDWSDTIRFDLDTNPGHPPEAPAGIVVVAVCVGVGIAVVGWVGIKIISACLKIHEKQVTNDQNQGESPILDGTPVPNPTGWVPVPPTAPADCQSCAVPPPPAGMPLPFHVEHSFDRIEWTSVSYGMAVDQEFTMPDSGYWRVTPLYIRMERVGDVLTVVAPPGVLEFSENLATWTEVSRSFSETRLPAGPGFYRVRLN